MIQCSILPSHEAIHPEQLPGKTVIVIDTLRATTVMVTALANGARSIRCVMEPEEALRLRDDQPGLLLGGERHALKIPGFDLSNSPLEYTTETVFGRDLVMTTSNGTRTLLRTAGASEVLIGCLLNARAVMTRALESGRDILLLNAGTMGLFSLDDFITAGAMLHEARGAVSLTDLALAARLLYESCPEIHPALTESVHYGRLRELGLQDDLNYALRPNRLDVVPRYREGLVTWEKTPAHEKENPYA
ncbi:2-phosphosulfolactate phosphatase [Proteiniclasticum sp. QWL-01]|uniref:2-phosphosulfolactate phosphatase n=1 Tax=Proteiniclasticum sp. QWL-01 TaxID=3036945 RepID=UPI002200464E|nr:2-phosphosulfolactate phosphatase [Proteiniclasticum sp. QWL-01]UUM11257.1 2-phosphosulfolactate phosphatase [Clostridiaceae bacterium HFYG-1003]WFF72595.1 2-phosphosulfolactate phosphatase [Proteiniclasticum sp. QWL-01]